MMNYAGVEYRGELSEAKYRAGINFPELHIRPQNISSNLVLLAACINYHFFTMMM
jgi:hypothetical protein